MQGMIRMLNTSEIAVEFLAADIFDPPPKKEATAPRCGRRGDKRTE